MTAMDPEVTHHPLARADGSATYSNHLCSVLAAVNGPVEVQRRDELPEEAAIEVNIRPLSGVGGPRERWLESVVTSVLRSVLFVHTYPRTLIQVTLQVTKEPLLRLRGAVKDTSMLPSLINASFLALVDGGLPLETTMTAALLTVSKEGNVTGEPTEKELASCTSVHAFAYNQHGEMLMDQSSGLVDFEKWEEVAESASKTCLAAFAVGDDDEQMTNGTLEASPWLRRGLDDSVRDGSSWRAT